jgi:hypothetical protein
LEAGNDGSAQTCWRASAQGLFRRYIAALHADNVLALDASLRPCKGRHPFDIRCSFIFDKAFDWSGEKAKFAGWLRQISTQVLAKKLTVVASRIAAAAASGNYAG